VGHRPPFGLHCRASHDGLVTAHGGFLQLLNEVGIRRLTVVVTVNAASHVLHCVLESRRTGLLAAHCAANAVGDHGQECQAFVRHLELPEIREAGLQHVDAPMDRRQQEVILVELSHLASVREAVCLDFIVARAAIRTQCLVLGHRNSLWRSGPNGSCWNIRRGPWTCRHHPAVVDPDTRYFVKYNTVMTVCDRGHQCRDAPRYPCRDASELLHHHASRLPGCHRRRECLYDVSGRSGSIVGPLLQRAHDDRRQGFRYIRSSHRERIGRLRRVGFEHDLRRTTCERGMTGDHLVRDDAKRIEISAMVERRVVGRLLGRNICRRAEAHAGLRDAHDFGL
jgi:hypothetical protein